MAANTCKMSKYIPIIVCCVLNFAGSSPSYSQCQPSSGDFEEWMDLTDSIEFELAIALKHEAIFPTGWFPLFQLVAIASSDFIVDYFEEDSLDLDIFSGIQQYSPGADGSDYALRISGDSLLLESNLLQVFSCSGRPERLTGQYKFVGEGADSLAVVALLHKSDVKDEAMAMGVARFSTMGGPSEYMEFSVDIDYSDVDLADSATILIHSLKDPNHPNDTSYYVLDELALEGGMVPTRDYSYNRDDLFFPNPAQWTISLSDKMESVQHVEFFDLRGVAALATELGFERSIDISTLPTGMYLARVHTTHEVLVQKLIISR